MEGGGGIKNQAVTTLLSVSDFSFTFSEKEEEEEEEEKKEEYILFFWIISI